jgi:hypothetical protein
MTPVIWITLMSELFDASNKLACKLWKAYDVTPLLLYQLSLCDGHETNRMTLVARLQRLADSLTPQSLIACSLLLAPESGRVRPKEHVAFEEQVLLATDRHGRWVW